MLASWPGTIGAIRYQTEARWHTPILQNVTLKPNICLMRRTMISKDNDVILRQVRSLVSPQFEHSIHLWIPYIKQNMETLEKVQGKTTERIWGFKNMEIFGVSSYGDMLKRCGLTALK